MKKFVLPLLATLTVLLLSACSIISDLIPEQELELFPTDNGSNIIESSSPISDTPPPTMEDFFAGTEASNLVSQADGEKYIAINLYRKFKDGDGASKTNIASGVSQGFGVETITLESQTAAQFPDEIIAQLYAPYFSAWDGFVAPEDNTYFWFLPQERRNALFASINTANQQNLSLYMPKEYFTLNTDWVSPQIATVESLGAIYNKDSNNCSETKCVYTLDQTRYYYCRHPFLRCGAFANDEVFWFGLGNKPLLFEMSIPAQMVNKLGEIATNGEAENSVSLSVWLKLSSSSDTQIPAGTATASLFLPNATAKVDFSN